MKKLIKFFPLLFLLILTSCEFEEVPAIEVCTWEMETVVISPNGSVLYYNPKTDLANVYKNAESLQLTCDADDRVIAFKDKTNGKTYTGTYQLEDTDLEIKQYKIVFGDVEGYAITGNTEYLNKDPQKTLIITIGDYTMIFYEIE